MTVSTLEEKIQEMQEKLNLRTLLLWSNFPGVPHEAVIDSITLFTEQVMPHFTDQSDPAEVA